MQLCFRVRGESRRENIVFKRSVCITNLFKRKKWDEGTSALPAAPQRSTDRPYARGLGARECGAIRQGAMHVAAAGARRRASPAPPPAAAAPAPRARVPRRGLPPPAPAPVEGNAAPSLPLRAGSGASCPFCPLLQPPIAGAATSPFSAAGRAEGRAGTGPALLAPRPGLVTGLPNRGSALPAWFLRLRAGAAVPRCRSPLTAAVVPVPAEHPLSTRVSQRPVPGSPGFAARSVRTGPGSAFRPSHRRLRLGSSAAFCLCLFAEAPLNFLSELLMRYTALCSRFVTVNESVGPKLS